MKRVELLYSKSKIDKAGEALKAKSLSREERERHLEILSNWRAFHVRPLDSFARVLKKRVKKIDPKAIIAQRLKRTPSIILKLKNHKTMRLSAMQDIGGLRVVFDNVEQVYKLIDIYTKSKTRHKLSSLDDYIYRPKEDGYRGVHLVYKISKEPSIFLEIQFRSSLQHIWATAVEVFGTLQNSSFKSGFGERRWLEFFEYLSSCFALRENGPVLKRHKVLTKVQVLKETKSLIDELRVIERLTLYTAVYKIVLKENEERGRRGGYSLITLNSNDHSIEISSFGVEEIELATQWYLKSEKEFFEDENVNVVLVNTGDLKKLEASYPNYFMDTRKLVMYLSEIVMDQFY